MLHSDYVKFQKMASEMRSGIEKTKKEIEGLSEEEQEKIVRRFDEEMRQMILEEAGAYRTENGLPPLTEEEIAEADKIRTIPMNE